MPSGPVDRGDGVVGLPLPSTPPSAPASAARSTFLSLKPPACSCAIMSLLPGCTPPAAERAGDKDATSTLLSLTSPRPARMPPEAPEATGFDGSGGGRGGGASGPEGGARGGGVRGGGARGGGATSSVLECQRLRSVSWLCSQRVLTGRSGAANSTFVLRTEPCHCRCHCHRAPHARPTRP